MVLFGVMAIVLVATAGAVVDFSGLEQARTRGQTALDAAALGLQWRIALDTDEELKAAASEILNERLNDAGIDANVDSVTTSMTDGSIKLRASIDVPTAFMGLIGIPSIEATLVAEATRKQLDLEVAMVLDNSGSMGSAYRLTNLKKAATCATNILFNGVSQCDDTTLTTVSPLPPTVANVKIGVAPFTEFVNVGTSYKTAAWMDQTGISAVARANFDSDDRDTNSFTGAVNRFSLYNAIGITWEGCVEARNHTQGAGGLYYDTSDLPASPLDEDSLFVPVFAPDQADSGYSNSYIRDDPSACLRSAPRYVSTQTKYSCNKNASSKQRYDSAVCDGRSPLNEYEIISETGLVTAASATRPASLYDNPDPFNNSYTDTYATISGSGSNRTNRRVRTWTYEFSDREMQERLCKYVSGNHVASLSSGPGGRTGPNADCPGTTLLPLTGTKSSVISKIGAMNASGGTNIHQGVIWGYRALSPTAPLTQAKPYDGVTAKVMIVMTDGENTHSYDSDFSGADWYTAYGYPYSGRLAGGSTAELQTEMDARTLTTCTNAKSKDITIYTVGLNPPNQSTRDMLTACATDPAMAYFPSTPSQLVDVFQAIAGQLADLRLSL